MKRIARSLRQHRLILNYFKAQKQFADGVIEGLNNKARVLGKLPEPELTP